MAKKIQSIVKGLIVIEEFFDSEKYNYRFLMYLLSDAHLVISDRYHQLILSMLVGTLVVPVEGNTSKTTGLFEMLNYNIPLLPILNQDKLLEFKKIISRVSENYSQLLENLPQQSSFAKFDHYNEILNR